MKKDCTGGDDCCTSNIPCSEGEGDCDSDSECRPGLICGHNNCNPETHDWDPVDDCCLAPKDGNNKLIKIKKMVLPANKGITFKN